MSMSYSFFLIYILTFEITFMLLYSATNLLECTCLELRLHLKSQPGHNGSMPMGMTVNLTSKCFHMLDCHAQHSEFIQFAGHGVAGRH